MVSTVKARDMKYSDEKYKAIITKCIAKGAWMWDPNCPGDEEERLYYLFTGAEISDRSKAWEGMEAIGDMDLDGEEKAELLGEGGVLAAGLHVRLPGASEEAQSTFMQELGLATEAAANPGGNQKKNNNNNNNKSALPRENEADPYAGLSTLSMVEQLLPQLRKEAGEAKGLSIELAAHSLGKELADQILARSDYMSSRRQPKRKLPFEKCKQERNRS